MQLTKFSDYALRVLMYAHGAGDRHVTIEEMAAAYRISRAHLMKVVNSLTRAGYLTALRGRSGGLVLGRPAEDIRLGEVVRATEPAFAIVECFSTNNQCVVTGCCRLAGVLDQALTAFLTVLDQHTLASVALKPRDFRAVFQIARQPTASKQAHGGVPMRSILTGHHAILPTGPDKSADK
jgi:Rrf2 family transcriptional regulator, nitric oxide-sensitive transcriptional repressor